MKEAVRLSRCTDIISSYNRTEPLASHLKKYFNHHREMGSTDRRICRELVYNYYRIGSALKNESMQLRLAVANFIFNYSDDETSKFLVSHIKGLNDTSAGNIADRFNAACKLFPGLSKHDLFPFTSHLSRSLDADAWTGSFFQKPMVWLRSKNKAVMEVKKSLESAGISFIQPQGMPLAFGVEPGVPVMETAAFKKGLLEIHDLSSQRTGEYFTVKSKNESWWDCCAGSGGKSLMLTDLHPDVTLTVSDIRPSILDNLKERFARSGQRHLNYFTADLTAGSIKEKTFDAIILDAPCTGSGTWNRTPEMLTTFDPADITGYTIRQKTMLKNIIPSLKPGGKIVYITCSVFREENEEVTAIAPDLGLHVIRQEIIDGTLLRADTMFAAELLKP